MPDLVQMKASDYGLEESKAKQISDTFKPMLDKMVDLEKEYNQVMKLEISPETCAKAKELRLRLVKVRTGTAEIHKELKSFYLQGGKFVDGWKNTQLMASQGLETSLKNIEDHYENLKREKMEKLIEQRTKELLKYGVDAPGTLGAMDDNVWLNYIAGIKVNYEATIAAEKKAEEDRIEAERKEALKQKRINQTSRLIDFIDNYDKIKFADLSEQDYTILCDTAIDKRAKHEEEQEAIRKENDRLKEVAIEKEKEAEKQRAILAKEAEKETEKREKAEAKLKAKEDAEAKTIQDEKEKQDAILKKGDKEKFGHLADELKNVLSKYSFNTKKYVMAINNIASIVAENK